MKTSFRYSLFILLLFTGSMLFSSSLRRRTSTKFRCGIIQVVKEHTLEDNDSLSICEILHNEYKKTIDSLSISKDSLKTVSLYWSDPGWVKGPDIVVNAQYFKVYFSTITYEQDKSVAYVDKYVYYFPVSGKGLSFMSNVYLGNHCHGGSFKLILDDASSCYDCSSLSQTLFRKKEPYMDRIEYLVRRLER